MKCSSFISSFNKLHFSYANVQPCILSKLFKSFCTSYYGSSLWSFSSEGFRKITTLWNIAVRKIFILPNTTHRHLLGPLLQGSHRNRIMNFHDFSMTICHFSMTFEHQLNSFATTSLVFLTKIHYQKVPIFYYKYISIFKYNDI